MKSFEGSSDRGDELQIVLPEINGLNQRLDALNLPQKLVDLLKKRYAESAGDEYDLGQFSTFLSMRLGDYISQKIVDDTTEVAPGKDVTVELLPSISNIVEALVGNSCGANVQGQIVAETTKKLRERRGLVPDA